MLKLFIIFEIIHTDIQLCNEEMDLYNRKTNLQSSLISNDSFETHYWFQNINELMIGYTFKCAHNFDHHIQMWLSINMCLLCNELSDKSCVEFKQYIVLPLILVFVVLISFVGIECLFGVVLCTIFRLFVIFITRTLLNMFNFSVFPR